MAATDLEMYRGDDKTYNLSFTNSTGSSINITGCTIFFTVKNKLTYQDSTTDSDALITSSITSHSIATSGQSILSITSSMTNSLSPGKYIYDMQLKDTTGNIQTFISGAFIINADVTRRVAP